MRKFLWVVAVGALVVALAAPAMALDFKFGGEYRVRFYSYDNLASPSNVFDHNQVDRNPRGAQIRVRPMFTVSDDNGNIQAAWRAEIGDIEFGNGGGASGQTNGQSLSPGGQRTGPSAGGSFGTDGVNVETKWIYLDAALPFNIPLRVRGGLQGWYLPKGLIVDDDVAGVRAYGSVKPISYEIGWFRVSGGPATAAVPAGAVGTTNTSNRQDNNYDFYQFKVDAALAPFLNPGVYFLYGRNAATTTLNSEVADSYYIGFTATGKAAIVSYDLDFVYGSAEGSPTGTFTKDAGTKFMKVKGFAVDGGVHFPVGPLTLNVLGSYATGDKQNGGDSEAFPTIAASWNGAGGQYELIGSGGTFDPFDVQDTPTNLWMLGATVEYRPVKALWMRLAYGLIGFAKSKGNCAVEADPALTCFGPTYNKLRDPNDPTKGKSMLGHEVSLRADYNVWTGFKVQGVAGVLIPTQGVPATELAMQLLYNF